MDGSERLTKVLVALANRGQEGCTIGELAKEAGASYGAVRRILLSLESSKWAVSERAPRSNASIWVIGPELNKIAIAYQEDVYQQHTELTSGYSSITGKDIANAR
jgi:DNA-binding IclR family transcriptional regulator